MVHQPAANMTRFRWLCNSFLLALFFSFLFVLWLIAWAVYIAMQGWDLLTAPEGSKWD